MKITKHQKRILIILSRSFETIFFDKDFLGIFNSKKIKEFILEII